MLTGKDQGARSFNEQDVNLMITFVLGLKPLCKLAAVV